MKDLTAIAALPALLLTVNSLVLHQEDLKPKGIPTLFTCKVMLYRQILGASSLPPRVPILFDLRAGLTGPRGACGSHLLWLCIFIHHWLLGCPDAFWNENHKTLQSQEEEGIITAKRVSVNNHFAPETAADHLAGGHQPEIRTVDRKGIRAWLLEAPSQGGWGSSHTPNMWLPPQSFSWASPMMPWHFFKFLFYSPECLAQSTLGDGSDLLQVRDQGEGQNRNSFSWKKKQAVAAARDDIRLGPLKGKLSILKGWSGCSLRQVIH